MQACVQAECLISLIMQIALHTAMQNSIFESGSVFLTQIAWATCFKMKKPDNT